ncbi:hypothetical protein EH11_02109 [Bacillus subtilis]|nr:hypothetical protein HS3_00908 [Bacillus subtilis]RPK02778.1 hypothetical protein EH11_02109 [Bacillus subtilis]RPK21166.1 hypothetical protein EH2_00459 [Bacillus subtilis]
MPFTSSQKDTFSSFIIISSQFSLILNLSQKKMRASKRKTIKRLLRKTAL